MLFGNPSDFAIEAGIEPHLAPPSQAWGHMRVFCGGIALGDIDNRHCGLYGAYCGFTKATENLPLLWEENFNGLDDLALWNILDGLLYGYHGEVPLDDERSYEQVCADMRRYGKFNFLTNWDEPFDHHKAFLLAPPNRPLRVLARGLPPSVGLGINFSRDGFTAACLAFGDWYKREENRLLG